jgi:integrase
MDATKKTPVSEVVNMRVRKTKPGQKRPWEADLGKIGGKRVRKFFETKDQAEGFVAAKERERLNHGTESLSITEAERAEYRAAKAKLPPGASLLEAVEHFNATRKTLVEHELGKAIAECVADKAQAGNRKRSVNQLGYSLGRFGIGREEMLCSRVTAQEIKLWLNGNGWATSTRKGYLGDLRTFFSWCLRQGYVASNPALNVEKPKPEPTPPRNLSLEQIRALLTAGLEIDPELTGGLIAPALFGGSRAAETRRLQDGSITEHGIHVQGHIAKTRANRLIEQRPQLAAWLRLCTSWPLSNWQDRLGAVRRKAAELLKVDAFPWPKNCLRHSFCSYAIHILGPQDTASFAGHSQQQLYATYRALVPKADALAWSKLTPQALGWKPKRLAGRKAGKARGLQGRKPPPQNRPEPAGQLSPSPRERF